MAEMDYIWDHFVAIYKHNRANTSFNFRNFIVTLDFVQIHFRSASMNTSQEKSTKRKYVPSQLLLYIYTIIPHKSILRRIRQSLRSSKYLLHLQNVYVQLGSHSRNR